MNRTTYIVIFSIIAIVLLAGGIFIFLKSMYPTPVPDTTPASQNNAFTGQTNYSVTNGKTSTSTLPKFTVKGSLGGSVAVKDFIHNGETVADTVNPGYFYLAGSVGYCLANGQCPSGAKTDDFIVTYNEKTQAFNVVLLTTPLKKSRAAAEVFMMDRLGINESQMCAINYWVGVPDKVDPLYSNSNLGFSFCPGATGL